MKNLIIEKAKEKSIKTGMDLYLQSHDGKKIYGYCKKNDIKSSDWILGKISLSYKDKKLNCNPVFFLYPIRYVELYKNVQIIETLREGKTFYTYTIFKNRNCDNENQMFRTVNDIRNFIDSFDFYSEEDKNWFLIKE